MLEIVQLERRHERPEWTEDPKPTYLRLRQLYEGAASRFAGKEESVLREELLQPALQVLGFEARLGKKSGSSAASRTIVCIPPQQHQGEHKVRPYSKLYGRCASCIRGDASWTARTINVIRRPRKKTLARWLSASLERGEAAWVLMTNGKLWRLYAQHTHSRATNYYEIDLEEVLAQAGPHTADPAESSRYFWLLFRRQAFELVEVEHEGKKASLSLLDQLLLESEDYAKELGERLKERVFEEVFPHLAAGFIAHIRERDGLCMQLQHLISQYCAASATFAGVKTENFAPDALVRLLAVVGEPGGHLRIPADILHDLLAYLAEQMTELNKQKQVEVKRFLGWLEKELKIQPDKNGNSGIEALTGKTTLKNYLGDYQKGEEYQRRP